MQDMVELKRRGVPFPRTSLVPDAGFPVNYGQKGSLDAEIVADCTGNLTSFDSGTVRNVIPDSACCTLALDMNAATAGPVSYTHLPKFPGHTLIPLVSRFAAAIIAQIAALDHT